jgi:hypothetical protein
MGIRAPALKARKTRPAHVALCARLSGSPKTAIKPPNLTLAHFALLQTKNLLAAMSGPHPKKSRNSLSFNYFRPSEIFLA